jgi:pyridoxal phosphate enzyme (YggS family)
MPGEILQNLQQVKARIARAAHLSGRDPGEITLVGVTKTVSVQRIAEAVDAGLTDLGENRVQEALGKIAHFQGRPVNWHLIGQLQTNKVRQILPRVELIHSLDRFKLAKELDSRAENLQMKANCLVEVNVAGEASKAGLPLGQVDDFVGTVVSECPHVAVHGLMTVAPYAENPEDVRCYFRQLRRLFDRMADVYGFRHLSMGMSNDFEVAIAEGATMVRVGTAIFGRR